MHYKRGDCESDHYNQNLFLVFKSLKRFVYILIYTEHQLLWAHIHKPSHPVLIIPYTAEVSQARALSDHEVPILLYDYEQCACVYNATKKKFSPWHCCCGWSDLCDSATYERFDKFYAGSFPLIEAPQCTHILQLSNTKTTSPLQTCQPW